MDVLHKMKFNLIGFALATLLVGCSPKQPTEFVPASSLEEIKEIVSTSYQSNDPQAPFLLVKKDHTPQKLLDGVWKFFEWAWTHDGYELEELRFYPVEEHKSKMNLPGSVDGREMVYVSKPNWWLRLRSQKANSDPERPPWTIELEFAVSEVNGSFFFSEFDYKK